MRKYLFQNINWRSMVTTRWISILGLAILVLGVVFPSVVPVDQHYRYEVNTIQNSSAPGGSEPQPIPYERLSEDEKKVFDTGINTSEPIIRDEPVNGTNFVTSSDTVGFDVNMVAVSYRSTVYVVEGYISRSTAGLRFWVPKILIVIGALLATIGLVASKTDLL